MRQILFDTSHMQPESAAQGTWVVYFTVHCIVHRVLVASQMQFMLALQALSVKMAGQFWAQAAVVLSQIHVRSPVHVPSESRRLQAVAQSPLAVIVQSML